MVSLNHCFYNITDTENTPEDLTYGVITENNSTTKGEAEILFSTNFNYETINNIFSNVSTLDFEKLFKLKKDFEKFGYSTTEIFIHLSILLRQFLFVNL